MYTPSLWLSGKLNWASTAGCEKAASAAACAAVAAAAAAV